MITLKMICPILMLTILGVVPLVHAQLAEWHLTVYIYNIPQGTGNMDVQIYGPHSSIVLISETINGDQTGSASASFNIAGSDIGFGDNYKICVSGQSVSPACFSKIHNGGPNIIQNIRYVNAQSGNRNTHPGIEQPNYETYNDPRTFENIWQNFQNNR